MVIARDSEPKSVYRSKMVSLLCQHLPYHHHFHNHGQQRFHHLCRQTGHVCPMVIFGGQGEELAEDVRVLVPREQGYAYSAPSTFAFSFSSSITTRHPPGGPSIFTLRYIAHM